MLGFFQSQRQRPGDPTHPTVAAAAASGGAVGSRAPRTAAVARSPGCHQRPRRPRSETAPGLGPPGVVHLFSLKKRTPKNRKRLTKNGGIRNDNTSLKLVKLINVTRGTEDVWEL